MARSDGNRKDRKQELEQSTEATSEPESATRELEVADASTNAVGEGSLDPLDLAYSQARQRVAEALRVAEENAAQMRADARSEAADILREAERRAAEQLKETAKESERRLSEAEENARNLRLSVDAYAKRQREEADEEARQIMEIAQAQARAERESAEKIADELKAEAVRRKEELVREIRAIEQRARRILDGLEEIIAQAEETPDQGAAISEEPPRAEEAAAGTA
jgi:hypothetical protein